MYDIHIDTHIQYSNTPSSRPLRTAQAPLRRPGGFIPRGSLIYIATTHGLPLFIRDDIAVMFGAQSTEHHPSPADDADYAEDGAIAGSVSVRYP